MSLSASRSSRREEARLPLGAHLCLQGLSLGPPAPEATPAVAPRHTGAMARCPAARACGDPLGASVRGRERWGLEMRSGFLRSEEQEILPGEEELCWVPGPPPTPSVSGGLPALAKNLEGFSSLSSSRFKTLNKVRKPESRQGSVSVRCQKGLFPPPCRALCSAVAAWWQHVSAAACRGPGCCRGRKLVSKEDPGRPLETLLNRQPQMVQKMKVGPAMADSEFCVTCLLSSSCQSLAKKTIIQRWWRVASQPLLHTLYALLLHLAMIRRQCCEIVLL
nr:uncharacterized protein LOC105878772 [Microcebus murinus]